MPISDSEFSEAYQILLLETFKALSKPVKVQIISELSKKEAAATMQIEKDVFSEALALIQD